MKKSKILLSFMLLLVMAVLGGCKNAGTEVKETVDLSENQIYIYYVNSDRTDMVESVYTLDKDNDLSKNVRELIMHLSDMQATSDCLAPIPDSITYIDEPVENERGMIEVSFM